MKATAMSHGHVANDLVSLIFFAGGLRAFYQAYMGTFVPGPVGSRRPSEKAEWHVRGFMILGGTLCLWVAWVFLTR